VTNTILLLGRHGDIINLLPLAYHLSKKGKVEWIVGHDFEKTLSRCSYVTPREWHGSPETLLQAMEYGWRTSSNLLVGQCNRNSDKRRMTDSFCKEEWRLCGYLDEYGKWPLIFDRRDLTEEDELVRRHVPDYKRPLVLVSTTNISTPFKHANKLIAMIRGLDVDVIDMDNVRADSIIDLLGLYELADCLVTVDTVHLHLARASNCPVIAILNDGWLGAVPPPQVVASWTRSEIGKDLTAVVEAAKRQISCEVKSLAVVVNSYDPSSNRHKRAMETHLSDFIYVKARHPKMRDFLGKGLETGKDVIVFTNDDVAFLNGSLDKIRQHAGKWNFGCSRRPRDPVHIGREIFWFRRDWLKDHLDRVPNPYWSAQKPDLIMARWMRKQLRIPTTMENLKYDFAPVEIPDVITHEEHQSHWATPEIENSFEGQWNEQLWSQSA